MKQVFTRYRCWCPTCGEYHESEVPGVMPRFMFSNALLAQALVVDRYAAYGNTWKGPIQYCLEHYKRNVRDLLEKPHRFFQWVGDPDVEAENNLAERRIRPLVIARKTSFGSQSEKGLRTRETLASVVCTLALRCDDPVAKLSSVFDALARNPEADVAELLWGKAEA